MKLRISNRSGNKVLTGIFLFLLIAFSAVAGWLCWKNDFSPEVEGILFKAIGAVAVATYFMVSTFIINSKKEIEFQVSVPVMYEPTSGAIFSPYRKSAQSLPEEGNMFKGLDEYNMKKLCDRFHGMELWQRLRLAEGAQVDFNSTDRMAYLEFVLLSWLEIEVNWLKVFESIGYTHAGHGVGASLLNSTPSVATKINLDKLANANPFFELYPMELTLPKGSKLQREVINGMINLTIKTDTGDLSINFLPSSGGIFDERLPSKLVSNMAALAKHHIGQYLPPRLWADYPVVRFKYRANKISQFSDQAKSEMDWLNKIDKHLFKDFSWDLVREYLSFDYQAALNLYRNYSAKIESAK
jgi:hypothetical protein